MEMSLERKETIDELSTDYLLQIVKESLEELGISYEEKPGGFGSGKLLDPSVFDLLDSSELFTIKTYAPRSRSYNPKRSEKFHYGTLSFSAAKGVDYLPLAS